MVLALFFRLDYLFIIATQFGQSRQHAPVGVVVGFDDACPHLGGLDAAVWAGCGAAPVADAGAFCGLSLCVLAIGAEQFSGASTATFLQNL